MAVIGEKPYYKMGISKRLDNLNWKLPLLD
jgi:hypothetical protein